MTTCCWVSLIIFSAIMVLFSICSGYIKEYWRQVRPRCWNDGVIFDFLKCLFWVLSWLSFGVIIPYWVSKIGKIRKKYGIKSRYWIVDFYVLIWFFILLFIVILHPQCIYTQAIVVCFIAYRLFEIFQSWVSQFILGGTQGNWNPRNIHRTLLLVIIDYTAIIFSFAILAFIFKDNYQGINVMHDALIYSLGNAITIGSKIKIVESTAYWLFGIQIMFTFLFLVAAVNRIFAHKE